MRARVAVVILFLAGSVAGCTPYQQTSSVEGYLLTLYHQPKEARVGDMRVGLRLQDRDYAIISDATVNVVLLSPQGATITAQPMEPGRGRDFRTRLYLAHAGEYRLLFQAAPAKAGRTLTVDYRLRVKQ